jgi:predicted methyltransferase
LVSEVPIADLVSASSASWGYVEVCRNGTDYTKKGREVAEVEFLVEYAQDVSQIRCCVGRDTGRYI